MKLLTYSIGGGHSVTIVAAHVEAIFNSSIHGGGSDIRMTSGHIVSVIDCPYQVAANVEHALSTK